MDQTCGNCRHYKQIDNTLGTCEWRGFLPVWTSSGVAIMFQFEGEDCKAWANKSEVVLNGD